MWLLKHVAPGRYEIAYGECMWMVLNFSGSVLLQSRTGASTVRPSGLLWDLFVCVAGWAGDSLFYREKRKKTDLTFWALDAWTGAGAPAWKQEMPLKLHREPGRCRLTTTCPQWACPSLVQWPGTVLSSIWFCVFANMERKKPSKQISKEKCGYKPARRAQECCKSWELVLTFIQGYSSVFRSKCLCSKPSSEINI